MAYLGIDYGTTNTVVVCSDRGRYPLVPHIAETAIGPITRETFPSLIAYDRKKDRFLFGAEAERSLYSPGAAERFAVLPSMKRLLRDYAEGVLVGRGSSLPDSTWRRLACLRGVGHGFGASSPVFLKRTRRWIRS